MRPSMLGGADDADPGHLTRVVRTYSYQNSHSDWSQEYSVSARHGMACPPPTSRSQTVHSEWLSIPCSTLISCPAGVEVGDIPDTAGIWRPASQPPLSVHRHVRVVPLNTSCKYVHMLCKPQPSQHHVCRSCRLSVIGLRSMLSRVATCKLQGATRSVGATAAAGAQGVPCGRTRYRPAAASAAAAAAAAAAAGGRRWHVFNDGHAQPAVLVVPGCSRLQGPRRNVPAGKLPSRAGKPTACCSVGCAPGCV